jgi:hypothetical protein
MELDRRMGAIDAEVRILDVSGERLCARAARA